MPGGIERLRLRLDPGASTQRSAQGDTNAPTSTVPAAPPQAHLRSPDQKDMQPRARPQKTPRRRSDRLRNTQNPEALLSQGRDFKYLLLCVNTKRVTKLVHVDLTSVDHDQTLFQQIRANYQRVRGQYEWRLAMLMPKWLCPAKLKTLLDNAHIYLPQTADFVQVY